MSAEASGRLRAVSAPTFRAWYEALEETVSNDPDDIVEGNQRSAVMLLHDLIGIGLREGAIRPVVIHSSGPSSFAHLMFRYTLETAFDWNGQISVGPEVPIAEIERATDIPKNQPPG